MDNNVLVPKPHRILNMLKHTKTECTFRVACDTEPGYGQFFMLSLPKVGEAPISASGKGRGYVEFTIRNVGLLTQAIFELEPGEISEIIQSDYGFHIILRRDLLAALEEEYTVNPDEFAGKSHNTPYAGLRLAGRVKVTVKQGVLTYQM